MVVFFLVLTVMLVLPPPHSNSSIDLALVAHPISMPGADRENAILIGILRDGTTFLGQDKVSADRIAPRIREKVRSGSERRAYIKVDRRVRYGHVVNVINAVSDA